MDGDGVALPKEFRCQFDDLCHHILTGARSDLLHDSLGSRVTICVQNGDQVAAFQVYVSTPPLALQEQAGSIEMAGKKIKGLLSDPIAQQLIELPLERVHLQLGASPPAARPPVLVAESTAFVGMP